MNKIRNILWIGLFLLSSLSASSQNYKIDVKFNDLQNEDVLLGYYYGNKTYVKDTIKLDEKGRATFSGDSLLDQGIYLIVLPSKNYFDVLIDDDQQFSIETSSNDIIGNLIIKGSDINQEFLEFQSTMSEINMKSSIIQQKLGNPNLSADSSKLLRDEYEGLTNRVKELWEKVLSESNHDLLKILINSMKSPEIPEIEVDEKITNKDSAKWFFSYNYNCEHYFDYINFSDERYLRVPSFHNKLETFFTKVLVQDPDTINRNIDIVAIRAEKNDDVFQYVIQYLINTFQKSNIMGMDKVFLHIAENYYLTDKVDWINDETTQKLKEEVAKLKFNILGNIAQDLKMETINQEYAQLHEIKSKFTLIVFWEPHCGHCKKVVPKVHEMYQNYSRDEFQVFSVYTQGKKEEWAEYINDKGYDDWYNVWDPYHLTNFRVFYNIYSTPTLYLLDENKRIIAKRISTETLQKMLDLGLGKKTIEEIKEEHN